MKIQYDSRNVQLGDIFLAMPGLSVDGRCFIQQAIEQGASKIYYEKENHEQFLLPQTDIPLIPVAHLTAQQGHIAAQFYDCPSRDLTVIGITGTNGKTSISYFIAQCLADTAVLGTTGYGRINQLKKCAYTTPMAPQIQELLKECKDTQIKNVAMEVSSHALSQERVAGVEFDYAVFTNLSHDHLDFHGDMRSYATAKKRLFQWPTLKQAVVNVDDPVGREIVQAIQDYPVITYGMQQHADIYADAIRLLENGFAFRLHTPWGVAECRIALLGRFNIANCLAVVGVLGAMGMPLGAIVQQLAQLTPPPGRMQLYQEVGKPLVAVDFAHTPDALEKALRGLREHCRGKLYVVFGCGGDRDTTKRRPMGVIASQFADYIVITNDNPRHERAEQIAQMICQGVDDEKLVCVELNRRRAIHQALDHAQQDDLVLIAGKGHEAYQIMGDEVVPFNDGDVVMEHLKSL